MKIDIARTLILEHPEGAREVTIQIGPLRPMGTSGDFELRLHITGLESREVDIWMAGVDSFQALRCAMHAARTHIEIEPAFKEGRLYFLGQELGHGFDL